MDIKYGMKNWGVHIIQDIRKRGFVEVNGVFYPPNSPMAATVKKKPQKRSKTIKTGWIDDSRNIRNKAKYRDAFIQLVEQELGVEVWPEFYFSVERKYRIDYAIPTYKIAIEQEGGIWAKGNSGHSSGTGIKRDMDKNNLLQANGWRLIRRQPSEMMTSQTISLIDACIKNTQFEFEPVK